MIQQPASGDQAHMSDIRPAYEAPFPKKEKLRLSGLLPWIKVISMGKYLELIKNKHKQKVWLRAFRMWQRRPHEVAPMSEEQRTCATCGTEYTGNYCPRCGQSANVGRYSFKKAFLGFLDVWGIGNRGMFHSIRDLMLRPGYMIRDYLNGMQSAYFPPFKMFFLLTAFSLLVDHGKNFGLQESEPMEAASQKIENAEMAEVAESAEKGEKTLEAEEVENEALAETKGQNTPHRKVLDLDLNVNESLMMDAGLRFSKMMDRLSEKNPAIFSLLSLLLFSIPLFFFIRSNPNIPDLRFSEFVIALVYTSNGYSLYSIVGGLLDSLFLRLFAVFMIFVTFKQLSGFSKWRIFRYLVYTAVISFAMLVLLTTIGISIIYSTSSR